MLKHILASTALATLLATGAYAQTDPAVEPAQDPAAPLVPGAESAAEPMADPAAPDVVEDDTMAPDATVPEVVEDDTMTPEATTPDVAEETAPVDGDADTMTTEEVAPVPADTMTAEGDFAPVDLATFSTDRLIGANIVTADDETIATIEDVLISDDGAVDSIVAQFGGFLGFGANRVLLTMDEIEVLQDPNETLLVRSSLTPESIETRPVYEE